MKTGIISSTYLYDATSAAFSSHSISRKNYDDIILQQINSPIDILIGEGKKEYDKYEDAIKKTNKLYVDDWNKLPNNLTEKLICTVDNIYTLPEGPNSLLSYTKYALNVFSESNSGFFIVIEGAKIDWESHDNDIMGMVKELERLMRRLPIV